MKTDTDKYRSELLTALRLRDVQPDRIGEVLAEVDSHIADTGEDPRDVFGTPREYARQFPSRDVDVPSSVRRNRDAARALLGAAVGLLSSLGVMALVRGDDHALGLPSWLVVTVGAIGACALIVSVSRRSGRVTDPRTGATAEPHARWFIATLAGAYLALIGACGMVAAITN